MPSHDYKSYQEALSGGGDDAKIEALKALLAIPEEEFDKSQLPTFFRLLRPLVHTGSNEVQYTSRRVMDRLKALTGLGDLALVLTDFLDEDELAGEPERPELVYGTIPYWLYELNSKDYRIRIKAVMELSQSRQRRIFETLCEYQDREDHEWVHATYAKYLGNFGDEPGAYERVLRYLDHPDNRTRANCLEGLELYGSEKAAEKVRPLLQDKDNRVRANAAKFLVHHDLETVKEALDEMLDADEEWMRDSATYILARVDFPGIETFLIRALHDENPVIAAKAARALARKGDAEAAREALQEFESTGDEQLSRAVHDALQILG